MNFSAPFIARPIGTILLAIGLLIAGIVAHHFLPVAPLPSVDIPTIVVFAGRPGADPETMATSIAAPLERRLGEIPGVDEITSTSSVGSTSIVIQFDIARPIEGAAHDVQAAINAATSDLPADLPTRPYYRKFNPAQAPIMTLALTSKTLSPGQVYDAADTILGQRLSQLDGVSQVQINGAEKPAVRVRLNPGALRSAGLAAQDVYTAIRNANITEAIGSFQGRDRAEYIDINGQMSNAAEYGDVVIKSVNGSAVRLKDVASVVDSVANIRLAAWDNRTPAILLYISKTAGANVIETDDRIKAELPHLLAWMPPDIDVTIISDGTTTIRASVDDVQMNLLMSVVLVLLVVLIFMRRVVPTLAAAATVPLSIAGTLAAMWLLGYSLDNFSLMSLTISVGFVVDDAIVMIENIARHVEMGKTPLRAAYDGARQIGFTVMSISISLVAVFIPIIFMGGLLGRLFHEFAMVLTLAIAISALVSLTLTPMLCGRFIPTHVRIPRLLQPIDRAVEWLFTSSLAFYARTLDQGLRWRKTMLLVTLGAAVGTVLLYREVPKGFLPTQDTGLLMGSTIADPSVSFAAMGERQQRVVDTLLTDPAVQSVGSTIGVSSGFASLNRGQLTIQLKPPAERGVSADQVIARLRPKLTAMPDVQTFLFAAQDLRGGGRSGGSQFQFILLDQDLAELRQWTARLETALQNVGQGITDVTSDQDRAGPQSNVVIDRDTAYRLHLSTTAIDNALSNAFSQRQISTIYSDRNQYKVVLEADPQLQTDPSMLDRVYVGAPGATQIPLSAVAHFERGTTPLAVRHQSAFPRRQHQLQPRPRHGAGRGHRPGRTHRRRFAHAGNRAHPIRWQRAIPAEIPLHPAGPHRRSVSDDLHRARRALRKPAAPTHHPQHPALCRARRAACHHRHRRRTLRHEHHRHRAADGHRQEKRHHAGRLRAGSRTRARPLPPSRHPRRLPGTLPPDHDDHTRRPAWRRAPRHILRRRLGIPPAPRRRHHRWPGRKPSPNAVHNTRRLPSPRTPRPRQTPKDRGRASGVRPGAFPP